MSDRTYGAEEKAKLERLVQEGVTVMQEIEDLQGGLKDTVKAVAEELDHQMHQHACPSHVFVQF